MTTLVAGLDLGSTGIKLLVLGEDGQEVFLQKLPTPWVDDSAGAVVMHGQDLLDTVSQLLSSADEALSARGAPRVEVLAITGMGESGFLIRADGEVIAPAFAWFDKSGQDEVEDLPEPLRAEFAGRTGLPWGVQVSAAKIAHLGAHGVDLTGTTWLSLPEYAVHALGGPAVAERSLIARTGLLDLDTGQPWQPLLDHLGLDPQVVPPLVDAGTALGTAAPTRVPAAFADAQLTVAGHDHLVSSLTAEADDPGRYHVSMGTAEVLLRVVDTPLTFDDRKHLAEYLINCVPHVVPDRWVIVAGVKTGLLMRRALNMLGVTEEQSRAELDAAVLALPPATASHGIGVAGARNDDGILSLTIGTDHVSPSLLMRAILEHGNAEINRLIEAMDAVLPPATSTLLTGGWASWDSVREARSRSLPGLEVSQRPQDTAYGATLLARALVREPLTTSLTP